jgi:hypothetical protein
VCVSACTQLEIKKKHHMKMVVGGSKGNGGVLAIFDVAAIKEMQESSIHDIRCAIHNNNNNNNNNNLPWSRT